MREGMSEEEYQKWVEAVIQRTLARKTCRGIQDTPSERIAKLHYPATLEERVTEDDLQLLADMKIGL
jgi:hypothetical protein